MNKEIEDILNKVDIGRLLIKAFNEFFTNDLFLLQVDANERSMTHRIGMYLQNNIHDWDVDCEYNRDDHDPKELFLPGGDPDTYDTDAQTVYPDIIIHKRGKQENLLVIEFKKTSSSVSDKKDYLKLREYKNQLGYKYALFVEFLVGHQEQGISRIEWVNT